MTRFDLTPFMRQTVGFDYLENIFDNLDRAANAGSYPPYNIEKIDDNSYRIEMAVAGFTIDDIEITSQENALLIKGEKKPSSEAETTYLHRGIATRSFEQRFKLADYVEVRAAAIENGMLYIHLEREIPEKMKPRQIEIKSGGLLEKVKKLTKSDKKAA